jgi:hypothetical protein
LKIFKYIYTKIFLVFLFNFKKLKSLDDDGLQNKCLNLEGFLKHDLDGLDLFSKLKVLKEILQIEESTPIGILNYVKRLDSFPNACIAYRILLTIPITVASIERSFSKLKLIKFYLRSTMSQGKLNRLAILSIEKKKKKKKMLENLEYKNLIRNFASQKVRITNFK